MNPQKISETLLQKDDENEIVSEDKNDDTLVVSNDISNELKPSDDTDGINKAITFNEEVIDNDLGITDLNDDIIKISDDDVMLDIESLDKNVFSDSSFILYQLYFNPFGMYPIKSTKLFW